MSLFLFSLACFSACLSVVGNLVNVSVPDPYMDEIFHIPQAQQYCLGNFTAWDSKITTLPGLYLISVGIISPLNSLAAGLTREPPDINSCSTQNLRSLNVLFGLINLSLVYCITAQLHGEKQGYSSNLAILNSLNLSLLPVLFMFNFLYYTDAVSTTMVLLTYSLHLAGTRNLSALAGLCSVLCRQTNIVWVFLVAALAAGQTITPEVKHHLAKTKHPPTIPLTSWGQIVELCQGTWALSRKPWRFARLLGLLIVDCIGYILVGIGFLIFVTLNEGIVVGDRSAHTAVFHVPQVLYFAAFFTGLSFAFTVPHLGDFMVFVKKNKKNVLLLGILLGVVIRLTTMAHPYLLADNRHLTFYLWRRVFMKHWLIKYLCIPLYIFSLWSVARCLAKSDLMLKIMFPVCVFACLVPQQLLEFRYFIVPFLITRLQVKPSSVIKLTLEFLALVLINVVVFYLFLYKPFTWENTPGEMQRFMW